METYTVRRYQEGDEEGIVSLLDASFNGWPHLDVGGTALDYWRWKYQNNFIDQKLVYIADSGKKVVGVVHSVPMKIKMFDKYIFSNLGGDVCVHPDYRKLGLWKTILQMANEGRREAGVKYLYNVTENPIVIETFTKMKDYKPFPHRVVNLVRIRDVDRQLEAMPVKNKWVKKTGYHVVNLANTLRYTLEGEKQREGLVVKEIELFDDRVDELWEEVSKHYDFIVRRDKTFLNWRYCDTRTGDFVVKQVEQDGRVLGYCALRINRYEESYHVGYIVDLLALPGRLDVVDALAAEAVDYFDSQGTNIVNCQTVKGHPYEKALNRHGFLDSRLKVGIFYCLLLQDEVFERLDQLRPERIYVSWGDYDTLPVRVSKVD
jgi:GNAT superfamily N-acetyltransferase